MVEILTGVPGSGKTYRAMYTLYANFAKDKKVIKDRSVQIKGIANAITNINELDYNKFVCVDPFNFDDLYAKISILYDMYKNQNADDTKLQEKAKELELLHTLIIIDEAHNYFDSQDKKLVWWLSYHRHLYHEIYLITQNLSLINAKYKAFCEFFYKAIPSSLKLFNNHMKYNQYAHARLSLNSKTGVKKIPVVKEVFESYGSGNNQKSKSMILKFLGLALLFVLLMVFVISFFFSSSSEVEITEQEKEVISEKFEQKPNNPFDAKPKVIKNDSFEKLAAAKKLIVLICSDRRNLCIYNGNSFDKKLIDSMVKIYKYEVVSYSDIPHSLFTNYYIMVDSKFLNLFESEDKNEKAFPIAPITK